MYISQPFGATSLNTLAARALLYGLEPVPLKRLAFLNWAALLGEILFLRLYIILKLPLRASIYHLRRLRWGMN